MIAIVLGTRPEIIKMSPVIRECERENVDYFILHTGQHYSYEMDRVFFEELKLPEPRHNLDVGSGNHGEQTGKIMAGVERVLMKESPEAVLVEGDTNTVLAGALASSKLGIKVGHVEAGLRSYDRSMPEELNRVLTDRISDYLFAPTETARENLRKEGMNKGVSVTGNTVVDALRQNIEISRNGHDILPDLNLQPGEYILVTAHRQENVDSEERLRGIINGLSLLREELGLPIIYPIHPRTAKMIQMWGVETEGIDLIDPVGYLEFLQLESNARLILTDSGGVQEEACVLGIPCVTLRENTERPETLEVGSNVLAGWKGKSILESVRMMLRKADKWENPYGDGRAGERIIGIMMGGLPC